MKLSALSKRSNQKHQKERIRVLEFIANNSSKKDFTDWLNANYEQQFAEDSDWEHLKKQVKSNTAIHTTALHNFAGTLTDQEDVNKLLKDVEKETSKAEATLSEIYDARNARRLQPVVGGASFLGGFLLIIAMASLVTGIIELEIAASATSYLSLIGAIYGGLAILAGLLLILK